MLGQRFIVILGLIMATAGCSATEEPVEITPGLQAFVGAQIIDGTGGAPITDGVLVVRDGRIEAVGSGDTVAVPADEVEHRRDHNQNNQYRQPSTA